MNIVSGMGIRQGYHALMTSGGQKSTWQQRGYWLTIWSEGHMMLNFYERLFCFTHDDGIKLKHTAKFLIICDTIILMWSHCKDVDTWNNGYHKAIHFYLMGYSSEREIFLNSLNYSVCNFTLALWITWTEHYFLILKTNYMTIWIKKYQL